MALLSFCTLVICVVPSLVPPLVFLFSSVSFCFSCILQLSHGLLFLPPFSFPPASACFLLFRYYVFLLSMSLSPTRERGQLVARTPRARGHCELGSGGLVQNLRLVPRNLGQGHFLLPQNRGMRSVENVLPTHDLSNESDISFPRAPEGQDPPGRRFPALRFVTQA